MSGPSILAVTSEMPWPLNSGGHLRTYHLLRSLAGGSDVRLVAPEYPPNGDGAATLRRAGIQTTVVGVAPRTRVSESWRAAGAAYRSEPYVLFGRHRRHAVERLVRAEAERRRPDILYLDHLDSLIYADCAPGARIVIDMHNVYSHLARRTAAESSGLRRRYLVNQAMLLERQERAAAVRADAMMTVSTNDAHYFSRLGARRVAVVPNGVDCAAFATGPAAQDEPPTILYVGSLDWSPNIQAARYLAREVLPAVRRQVPAARLLLVGRHPVAELLALATADPGVQIAANVPDVVPFFRRAAALAVPLEAGGGTRLKILEAFAAGLPVVSTRVGCEGIDAYDRQHLLVCERRDFAAALTRVLLEPEEARARARRALALVTQKYDWMAIGERAAEAIERAAQS
jgi:glycosyltransferase involved in cell wall biosynthesis